MPVRSNLKNEIYWLGGFHRCSQPPPQPPAYPPTWDTGWEPQLASRLTYWSSKLFGIWVDPKAYGNIWRMGQNTYVLQLSR